MKDNYNKKIGYLPSVVKRLDNRFSFDDGEESLVSALLSLVSSEKEESSSS